MAYLRKLLRRKGFTLIELMVVVIIVGILAAVAVPMYQANVRRGMATEGKAVVGSVKTAERVYYTEHDYYSSTFGDLDGIDYSDNKYFSTAPTITTDAARGGTFTATVVGAGDAAGVTVRLDGVGSLTVSGI